MTIETSWTGLCAAVKVKIRRTANYLELIQYNTVKNRIAKHGDNFVIP